MDGSDARFGKVSKCSGLCESPTLEESVISQTEPSEEYT
jgi:hypothetical protein